MARQETVNLPSVGSSPTVTANGHSIEGKTIMVNELSSCNSLERPELWLPQI